MTTNKPPAPPQGTHGHRPKESGITLLIMPDDSNQGPAREIVISPKQLRQWRWLTIGLLLCCIISAFSWVFMLPRSLAFQTILDENLALKRQVHEINQRMAEVDRILLRMRMYDAQLRDLYGPTGDHGPLPQLPPAVPPQQPSGTDWGSVHQVTRRADKLIANFEAQEHLVNRLIAELENVGALEHALPAIWPAQGELTSGYGYRLSPFGLSAQFHHGLDIANDSGTPIYASAAGRVVRAEYHGGLGRMVEIQHGFGIRTIYGHCSRLLVKRGDQVQAGERIANMGSTGRTTGPHLHFEVHIEDQTVNPLDYLPRD